MKQLSGILSLIGFSNLAAPSPFSALPPVIYHNASPKAISGRTSYIRVRLEFLRYPQFIRRLFTLDPARSSSISFTGLLPSLAWLPSQFYYQLRMRFAVLNPDSITTIGLASFPFARRYSENLFWFLFLRLLRCFSSAGLPTYTYLFSICWQSIALPGFPIRKSADL